MIKMIAEVQCDGCEWNTTVKIKKGGSLEKIRQMINNKLEKEKWSVSKDGELCPNCSSLEDAGFPIPNHFRFPVGLEPGDL